MPIALRFALSILIVTSLFGGMHFLMWKALNPLLTKKRAVRLSVATFLVLMTLGIPYNVWTVRFLPVSEKGIFSEATHIWLGLILYFLVYFTTLWIVFKFLKLGFVSRHMPIEHREARRQFLNRSLSGIVGAMTCATGAVAYSQARQGPSIEKVDIFLKRLPARMNGFKIVQISDLHVGPLIDHEYVRDVVSKIMQCKPDLIVLTGDFVDGSVPALSADIAPLQDLNCPHGVFFVTGNHDIYSGCGPWLQKFREMGIQVLENEHVAVGNEEDYFYLLGIHDPTAVKSGLASDVGLALAGCESDKLKILLAHQPKSVFQAEKFDIDLQLSGHTHAGQMWPLGFIAARFNPYLQGLHTHSKSLQIYVNRGTGFWGPPMRLPSSSEITEITLFKQ